MNNPDLILFEEIAAVTGQPLGGASAPYLAARMVVDCVHHTVQGEDAEVVTVAAVNEAVGLAPEQNWDATSIHLRELARLASESLAGVPTESPVAALTALSASTVDLNKTLAGPGLPRRELALALGMEPTATSAQVLDELRRIWNLLNPRSRAQAEIRSRLNLVGLSAGQREPSALAALFAQPFIDGSNRPNSRAHFHNVMFAFESLTPLQLIALTAAVRAQAKGLPAPTAPKLTALEAPDPKSLRFATGMSIHAAAAAARR